MRWLMRAIEWIVIALMAVIAVTVIAEVTLRDLFDLSLGIHEELTRYLMVWVAMLGSTLLTYEGSHIRINILPEALPERAGAVVRCLADIIVVLFLIGFVYACAINLPNIIGQHTITLGVEMIWFHAALPIGGLLMLLITLRNTAADIRQALASAKPQPA